MMRAVRLLALIIAAGLLVPATASAQAPPPDERAAAQALADAAKRLVAEADGLEDDAVWVDTCDALKKEPPARRRDAASDYANGLELRFYIDGLRPALMRFRTEIAAAQTADPVLRSGRAAGRRIARTADEVIPAGEADPCAAYEAYARAGYPEGPARAARALDRRLEKIATARTRRKIHAAAERMRELGVSRADARAFRQLAD
jgi:hypothetical protein